MIIVVVLWHQYLHLEIMSTWSSNKTRGNFEIMFRASTDDGKTFNPKINLSNSTKFDSINPSIEAEGKTVYIS